MYCVVLDCGQLESLSILWRVVCGSSDEGCAFSVGV